MNKEEFVNILREEGITRVDLVDDLWSTRPRNEELDKEKLRTAAKWFVKNHPNEYRIM